MRKSKALIGILSLITIALSGVANGTTVPAPPEAELIIVHQMHSHHSSETKIKIRQISQSTFECWSDSFPKHRLAAADSTALKAPFSSENVPPTCEDQVWWLEQGKPEPSATACYFRRHFPVLEEILQSCLNI